MLHASQSSKLPRRLLGMLCLLAGNLVGFAASTSAPARPVTVAVVKDGASEVVAEFEAAFRDEAERVTATRAVLTFKTGGSFDGGWRENGGAEALAAALVDPTIDYVIAVGVRAVVAAAAPDRKLPKPVLGAIVQETDLVALPIGSDGRAQKENFAIAVLPTRASEQLRELAQVVPFASLHVLVDEFFAPNPVALETWRDKLARTLQVPVTLTPLTGAGDDPAAFPSAADAVMLFPTIRMTAANRAALLQGLSARKFPVLGFLGQPDVEAGALAGLLPDARVALARRLAINMDQLIAGTSPAALPLRVALPSRLFYNEATASAIGHAAKFEALTLATPLGLRAAPDTDGRALSFTTAVLMALENNLGYLAQKSGTEAARQQARVAAGALLPQVVATQSFRQVDRDRARASGGLQPRSFAGAGLGVTQTIVDDESFTRARVAREAQRAATHLEQVERLDTVAAAGGAYLQLLAAQTAFRVAEENFDVTHRHLELARLRQRTGASGPEEAYRFESLSAQQHSERNFARVESKRARVALNRILHVPLDTHWNVADVTLEDPAFALTTARVLPLVSDRHKVERLRSFAAGYAAQHSPDLAASEQGLKARRLETDERRRRPFIPRIAAGIDYTRTQRQELAGGTFAEQLAAAGLPVRTDVADRNDWSLRVTATLPLFTGGSLTADARRARAELRQVELAHEDARAAVMAQAQSALYTTESTYAHIRDSRRAADLAAQNLAVVQDKYERGTVSIVALLDAQNAAFAQRQSADAAVYAFLSAVLQLQRTMGWIEVLATPDEKETWFATLAQAVTG